MTYFSALSLAFVIGFASGAAALYGYNVYKDGTFSSEIKFQRQNRDVLKLFDRNEY